MKKLQAVGLALCALLIIGPVAAQAGSAKEKPRPDGVLARVGPEKITEAEVQEVLDRMSPGARTDAAKRRVVDNIVELYVFALEAKKAGLLDDPEVKKRLKEVTTVVLARTFFDRYVSGKAEVPDEEARAKYEKYKDKYVSQAQVHVKHIMVRDKAAAEEVLARLKKGESFEDVAKEKSEDPMTGRKGGDMGWQNVTNLDPSLRKAVMSLKKGEMSEPVKTPYGFHIIKLIDSKPPHPLTFEDVKGLIKQSMHKQAVEKLKEDYIKKADIEIFMPDEPKPAADEADEPDTDE